MLSPHFDPFPELATKRLRLRRLVREDASELLFLRSDPRVMRFIAREPAKAVEEVEVFIGKVNENLKSNEAVMWAIALSAQPSTLIGTITLWQIQRDNYRAELGYMLHPDHWGKGLMTEAIYRVTDYGFGMLGLHSIEARADPNNTASIRLLEKTGFIKEGYFRKDYFFRGKFLDTAVYSLLAPASQPGL